MAKRLPLENLIQLAENVLHPRGKGFTSEEGNRQLIEFCINCPDPVSAMDIMLSAPRGSTAREEVSKAMACAPRDPNTLPEAKLARGHPLRHMRLEE